MSADPHTTPPDDGDDAAHYARFSRQTEELLTAVIEQRSVRIAQDAGKRIAKLSLAVLAVQHPEPINAAQIESICATSGTVLRFVKERGAAAGLPVDFVRDLQEALVIAFWRVAAPHMAAYLGAPR